MRSDGRATIAATTHRIVFPSAFIIQNSAFRLPILPPPTATRYNLPTVLTLLVLQGPDKGRRYELPDAPALLRRELAHPKWRPETIVMSAITDIYQPIEHKMRIARQCLEVLADCGQPVTTMTKSALVLRDTDLWSKLASLNAGRVTITLVTLDPDLAQKLEPRASSPAGRLRAIRELTAAGVPVSVNVAPVIPGLTDTELPAILEAVAAAGATRAFWVLLRLPYQLKDLFLDWLQRNVHPDRARKVESLIRQSRGGKLYESSYATRRRGRGPIVEQLAQTFDVFTRKHGLNRDIRPLSSAHFRRPDLHGQLSLF